MATYILHEDPKSMNCYKIRLVASMTGQPLERRAYNILKGETRTEEFLTKVNSGGKIPVLQIDEKTFMPESNAACYYLADTPDSKLIPRDRFTRAQMMGWMFFEQNEHEPNIASMRFWRSMIKIENLDAVRAAQVPGKMAYGTAILQRMDSHLGNSMSGWFVGDSVTLADLVLYAYTHVADEGGFDLSKCSHVQKWCKQIEQLDGYVAA